MNDPYPFSIDTSGASCAVCGNPVGSGKGFAHIRHEERMITLCCPLCLEVFQKKPDYYLAILEAAEALRPREDRDTQS